MKKAEMFSVQSGHANGYAWKWRCPAAKTESKEAFMFYHDCLADAEKHGYEVELTRAEGITAPGGAPHNMA